MTRIKGQRGSSLILLIGIIAALAALALGLVAVIANAQHNTLTERSQAKSFHVAEAALDAAMANISPRWPSGTSATPVPFPTASFQTQFPATEYPGPATGSPPAVQVIYFDDFDNNNDGFINGDDRQVDANGNGKMYIVAQGGVLKRASRVQALVQQTYYEPPLPKDNVLWCGGSVQNSGGGGGVMPKISVEDFGPLANGQVAADVLGNIADYPAIVNTTQIGVQYSGGGTGHNTPKTLEQAFPQADRESIIRFASKVGRYFDAANAKPGMTPLQTAMASQENLYGGPGLAGLTVVRQSTPAATYSLLGSDVLNSAAAPGILMLLGGVGFEIGGTAEFWGLLYVEDGTITVSHGTPEIHGALFCTKDMDFKGTANLTFSYTALSGFTGRWGSTVSMVPNTWRELQPK